MTTYEIGEAFEDYLLENIFKKENFILKERTPKHCNSHFPENALNPDLKFQCRTTNEIFWIESKFRNNEKIKFIEMNLNQIKRHQNYNEPVYYLIGLGLNPKKPVYMSLINCKRMFKITPLFKFHNYRINDTEIKNFNELLNLTKKFPNANNS